MFFQKDLLQGPSDKTSCESPHCKMNNSEQGEGIPDSRSLSSCVEELVNVAQSAKSGLTQARKDWEDAQERVKLLKAEATKCILNKILGKEQNPVKQSDSPINSRTPVHEQYTAKPGDFQRDFPGDFRIPVHPTATFYITIA